jgi:hypothetical protein
MNAQIVRINPVVNLRVESLDVAKVVVDQLKDFQAITVYKSPQYISLTPPMAGEVFEEIKVESKAMFYDYNGWFIQCHFLFHDLAKQLIQRQQQKTYPVYEFKSHMPFEWNLKRQALERFKNELLDYPAQQQAAYSREEIDQIVKIACQNAINTELDFSFKFREFLLRLDAHYAVSQVVSFLKGSKFTLDKAKDDELFKQFLTLGYNDKSNIPDEIWLDAIQSHKGLTIQRVQDGPKANILSQDHTDLIDLVHLIDRNLETFGDTFGRKPKYVAINAFSVHQFFQSTKTTIVQNICLKTQAGLDIVVVPTLHLNRTVIKIL